LSKPFPTVSKGTNLGKVSPSLGADGPTVYVVTPPEMTAATSPAISSTE
jgi:hypothetical protein